jgi:hypothetical protein
MIRNAKIIEVACRFPVPKEDFVYDGFLLQPSGGTA